MRCGESKGEGINSYAVVIYIPEPLGSFLDNLRRELVPGCLTHAHLTVLPPRPLPVHPDEAWSQIQSVVQGFPAFEIEPTRLEIFDLTSVIYLGIGKGWAELQSLHRLLNTNCMEFDEPFPYHPHITVAQELSPERVPEVRELAARRWAEYQFRATLPAATVTFVQNTVENHWTDLARCSLGAVPIVR